jgi:D-lactate dehydrogenase (cytochrome)
LVTDPEVVAAFLSDAAHVPGGHAAGVAFPENESDAAAFVGSAERVLPVGAQSSLTGGATPRGEIVLSTRAMTAIEVAASSVRVGAGVVLSSLQQALARHHLFYPPVPTFEGASCGGTIATNAAGAATFKYGSTRDWVAAITVVLANGDLLELERGEAVASDDHAFEIEMSRGETIRVPLPNYEMPHVAKLSAGYFARRGMDLVDLFVGSEGTLGIVTAATLKVVAMPRRSIILIRCGDEAQAIAVSGALRREAHLAWHRNGPLDVAAIEYIDARSLRLLGDEVFARAAVRRPSDDEVVLLVQIETPNDESAAIQRLEEILMSGGVTEDVVIALPGDQRGAQRLFELRESVPATVNALIGARKARQPEIHKTAGDMIVPFDRVADALSLYRRAFDSRGLEHAIWGHVSDGNLHPNVLPQSLDDLRNGESAILEIARGVMAMGGAPLAEHGVGRSRLKQRLLREMYGDQGIDEMRAVKRALDPEWKLSPGVLFPA